jgi:hypothetical protein
MNNSINITTTNNEGVVLESFKIEKGKKYYHPNFGYGKLIDIDEEYHIYIDFEKKGDIKLAVMGARLLMESKEV